MIEINNKNDLLAINGGLDISGAIVNAFTSGIKTIFDIGKSLGTSIRRLMVGNLCAIN